MLLFITTTKQAVNRYEKLIKDAYSMVFQKQSPLCSVRYMNCPHKMQPPHQYETALVAHVLLIHWLSVIGMCHHFLVVTGWWLCLCDSFSFSSDLGWLGLKSSFLYWKWKASWQEDVSWILLCCFTTPILICGDGHHFHQQLLYVYMHESVVCWKRVPA